MNLKRIFAVMLRQFYLMRGSFSRVVPLFAWVAVDMVLWGFLTRYLNVSASSGINFVFILLGAVLFWDFFIRVMQGVTMAFFEDVWSRNFLNMFASPITIAEYIIGLVVSSIGMTLIGLTAMILIAALCFGLSLMVYGMMIFPFLLILFLFGIAIGIFGCAIVLRLGPASEWFIWPIPAFLSPFVGVLYPISTLPQSMQHVSHLLPPSHVFEGMRAIVTGGTVSWPLLAWSGCLAIAYILLASWCFTRTYQHAVRTGLMARYSVESLS
ncbi:MAG TPA: ABC transporter permease [Candidatus Omnitrophota bacterium]|nr:ABC transporter permease [Candidatus Omnitrophota bacterium]